MSERTSTVIVGYGRLGEHLGWLFGQRGDIAFITRSGRSNDTSPTVRGNVRSQRSMNRAFKKLDRQLSPWSNIIYIAKQSTPGTLDEVAPRQVLGDIDATAVGALRTILASRLHMSRSEEATVTLVGGDFGRHPSPKYLGYSMGKAALDNLANGLIYDEHLRSEGVRVLEPVINGSLGRDMGHVAAAQEIYDHIIFGNRSFSFDVSQHDPRVRGSD